MQNRLQTDLEHILDHTRELWEEFRGQRIFITGGTGFFGCWLLESFSWANDRLNLKSNAVILTRDPLSFQIKAPHLANHPAVVLQKGNINNFEFPTGTFSHLIHAANDSGSTFPEMQKLIHTQFEGDQRVLEFASSSAVKKMLLTSSGAVYGPFPDGVTHISEDDPFLDFSEEIPTMRSIYAHEKRTSEMLFRLNAHATGIETKIARCFAFVGPYLPQNGGYAIGNFIRDALRGGPIEIKGDGTPYRSYLYAADLTIWLWTILVKGKNCRAYNVGSEKEINILQLAKIVKPQQSRHSSTEITSNAAQLLDFQTVALFDYLRASVADGGQPDRSTLQKLLP
ncbi:MAG: NAD-dependent epimerase/dehydratase family protein [Leptolinea sp.]